MKPSLDHTALLAATLLSGYSAQAISPAPQTVRVYFGSAAKQEKCGIYMASLDMQTGRLSPAIRVSDAVSPGFIALHPDGKHLYATGEHGGFTGQSKGAVSAFRISEPDGTLSNINTQASGGVNPCHLSIDPSGKNLLAANYTGASCAALPILPDGSLAPATAIRQHTGSSIHPTRQTKAFTHSICCDPSGQFAMVADLGTDKIMIYRLDADNGILTPHNPPFISTRPGGGPRHLTFHPSGKFAYVNMELSNEVTVFNYNAAEGSLSAIQTLSTLPDGFSGQSTTSEVLTTPDGRFLYVGNRGHNSLAIFAIDSATGLLTPLGHETSRGGTPRNFNIDPTGTFLIAANQKTDNAVVFRINPLTGLLEYTGSEIEVPAAICVRFFAAP